MRLILPSRRVRCQDAEWLAVLWLDGEMEEPTRRAFEAHIGKCDRCRAVAEELRASGLRWSSALRVPTIGVRPLADRVLDAVGAERERLDALRRGRPKRILSWTMAGLAVAIALALACLLPMPALMDPQDLAVTVPGELLAGGNTMVRVAVRDYRTGQPSAGRHVRLAAYEPGARSPAHVSSAVTDPCGIGVLPLRVPDAGRTSMGIVVLADNAFGRSRVDLQVPVRAEEELLVTTGRPLYQPGQEARIQAQLLRVPSRTPVWGGPISIIVLDPLGRRVYSHSDTADEFGRVSFTMPLATELVYGRYEVRAAGQDSQAGSSFQVRPYAAPPFEAGVSLPRPVCRRDAPLSGEVTARYDWGEAVASAPVTVRLVVDSDTVDAAATPPLASASGTTDAAGRYSFSLPPAHQIGWVRVEAVVTDGRGAQAQASARCSLVDGRPRIRAVPRGGALIRNLPGPVCVMLSYSDGSPAIGRVSASLIGPDGAPLGERETGEDGTTEYEVRARTDAARLRVTAALPDGVTSTETVPLPVRAPDSLVVYTDKAVYAPGDPVTVSLACGAATGDFGVDVVRDGQVLRSYTLAAASQSAEMSLAADPDMAGVLLLHGYRLDRPEVSAGSLFVVEPTPNLQVTLGLDGSSYRPGDEARLSVKTENSHGFPVSAAFDLVGLEEGTARALRQDPALAALYLAAGAGWVRPQDSAGAPDGIERLVYEWASAPESVRRGRRADLLLASCEAPAPSVSTAIDPARASYERALTRRDAHLKLAVMAAAEWTAAMLVWVLAAIVGARRSDSESIRERVTIPGGAAVLVVAAAACVGLAHALSQGGGLDVAPPSADSLHVASVSPAALQSTAVEGEAPVRWSPFDASDARFAGSGRHALSPLALAFDRDLATDAQGRYNCKAALPDADGSYVISALAVSAAGEIGWAEARIGVNDPVSCRVTTPDHLIVGQRAELHLQVGNGTEQERGVTVALDPASWYEAGPDPIGTRPVPAHSRVNVDLGITPSSHGDHELKLLITSGPETRGLAVPVRVAPAGSLITACSSGALSATTRERVYVDPASVEGSRDVDLLLFPGLNAHSLQVLGWAERTESSSAGAAIDRPALAAALLSALRTGEAGAQATDRAGKALARAYQTFLARRPSLGTDAYVGEPTPERAALELITLQHLRQLGFATPGMVGAAQRALCDLQRRDGTFRSAQPSAALDARCAATSGAVWALALSGYRGSALPRAVEALREMLPGVQDPYALALAANALLEARVEVPVIDDVLRRLADGMRSPDAEEPWHTAGVTLEGTTGAAADTEIAALVVLATDARSSLGSRTMGSEARGRIERVLRRARSHVVSSKTIDGVWATPYLTSIALRALATDSPAPMEDPSSATVLVDGEVVDTVDLADRGSGAAICVAVGNHLRQGLSTVAVESEGRARGDYLLTTRYYVRSQ